MMLWTLIQLSILGSVLALALTALRVGLKGRVSQTAACYLWLLVLLRLCVPLGVRLPVPAREEAFPSVYVEMADGLAEIPETPSSPAAARSGAAAAPQRAIPWAMLLWAAGAAASIAWFAGSYLRVSRTVRRSAVDAPPEAWEILRGMDPGGTVRLVQSPEAATPVLLGVVRPVIVLPAGMTDRARLRDVLDHELAHARRHDLTVKWFAAAVTSLHWFNPLMLLVRREVGRACELACDETVMNALDGAGRRHYGETLLALAARGLKKTPGPMLVALCGEKRQMRERLFCIAKYRGSRPLTVFLSLLLASVIGSGALIAGVTPVAAACEPVPEAPSANKFLADGPLLGDGLEGMFICIRFNLNKPGETCGQIQFTTLDGEAYCLKPDEIFEFQLRDWYVENGFAWGTLLRQDAETGEWRDVKNENGHLFLLKVDFELLSIDPAAIKVGNETFVMEDTAL